MKNFEKYMLVSKSKEVYKLSRLEFEIIKDLKARGMTRIKRGEGGNKAMRLFSDKNRCHLHFVDECEDTKFKFMKRDVFYSINGILSNCKVQE